MQWAAFGLDAGQWAAQTPARMGGLAGDTEVTNGGSCSPF